MLSSLQIGMGWFAEQAGGLNRVYEALVRHLPATGVTVRGLVAGRCENWPQPMSGMEAFAPIDAPLAERWRGVRRATHRALQQERPDVVAAHFALYTLPVLDVIRGLPLVVHFHGPWASESRVEGGSRIAVAAKHRVERTVYRRARRCIVLSTAFKEVLCRDYGVPSERVAVVPGGVVWERFAGGGERRDARTRLGWPLDRPTVLTVRRLRHRMGLEHLVDAAVAVRRRVPDVLVCIAGKGPLEDDLRARIASAGLADHVRLLGFVPDDDLPCAYRAADVTVVPTVALEGFGLTTVESLAAGTPVLVTPVGGLPEVVRDLASELVLPGATTDALAEGLTGALTGALSLPGADACKAFARTRYAWPVVAEQVRTVYEDAC